MTRRRHEHVNRLAIAAISLGVLGLSACAPTITNHPYSASDGVRVTLDDDRVIVNNLFFVTNGPCESGVVVGSVTAPEQGDLVITVASRADAVHITVPEEVCLEATPPQVIVEVEDAGTYIFTDDSPGGPITRIDPVQITPGGTLQATVSFNAGEEATVTVPVLDGSLTEYAGLAELAAAE